MNFKRLYCCILAIIAVLMLSIFPVSATDLESGLYQMPVEMGQQLPEGVQEAASVLREGMKELEGNIPVSFYVDASSFDGSDQAAEELAAQVQSLALAHTGVPNEGDYLLGLLVYMAPSEVMFVQSGAGWQFHISYYCAYWSTAEQEAELDAEIARLVQLMDLKGDQADYQKITAIYNYICTNVRYDYEHKEDASYALKQTAYAAAKHKTAVCQGYATLFYRLALEAGVDCRYITGYAGEAHAWNLVKLDGQYYYLDSTWDEGKFQYGYFLKSASDFWDHEPDARYMTEEFQTAHPIAQQSYQHPSLEGVTEDGFEYKVINGIAILTGYSGTAKDVVVPAKVDGYPLCEVARLVFYDNYSIESITFSEGIQILNSGAILACRNLKSVHLPSTVDFTASKDPDYLCNVVCGPAHCPSVETITVAEGNPNVVVVDNVLYSKDKTILRYLPPADPREVFEIPEGVISIGASAFEDNDTLKEVVMPDTVRMINMGAFEYCGDLEKINISNNCRQISQYAFSGTALESIHIPASVERLYAGSFGNYSQLKTITVDPANPYYYVEDGVLYGHYVDGIHTDNWYTAGDWLIKYPSGSDATSFTVPEGIVGIEQHAFDSAANLQEIILPDSLNTICNGAFWFCSGLTKIQLPDNLKRIGASPFSQCTNLVELVIPASVEHLDYYVIERHMERIIFLGDAPEMFSQTFDGANVDVYYPAGNATWTEAVLQLCGEAITRHPYSGDYPHIYDDNVDGTCNVCGINRADVEERIVVHMFRMYNPNTGEHFYTGSEEERDNLIGHGWNYEGIAFTFPANTGAPVHRLFQPSTGEHLYTMDEAEKDRLLAEGWNYEGVAFNSAYDTEAVQHRLHNPNATVGAYHFTFSLEEKQMLIDAGWEYQGIGWYSCWK